MSRAGAGKLTLTLPSPLACLRAEYDLYVPSSHGIFACLDGSKNVPFSAVNDDYCDCEDGSDEPGPSCSSLFLSDCCSPSSRRLTDSAFSWDRYIGLPEGHVLLRQ